MNAIQSYLRDGGTLEKLALDYFLNIKRHPQYNNLCLFKYDQINSRPENHPLIVCARGLILDEANNWAVVSWPFNRFFNYGQGEDVNIDWSSASVATKLDGSLMVMYYIFGNWHIQTSGSPAAEGEVQGFPFTFNELFWKTFNDMGLPLPTDTNLCFMWELTSPYNRVVVQYNKPQLTLIGIRELSTGKELSTNLFEYKYPIVKTYAMNTIDDIIASLKDISPTQMEGYVIRSNARDEYGGFLRLKVKSPQYIALHHLKDGWGTRRIVDIIRHCEVSEVLVAFPEFAEQFIDIQKRYDHLVDTLNEIYAETKDIPIQKDFALAIMARKCPMPGALFELRAGKINSVKQYIASIFVKPLMRTLGLKDTEE